MKRATFLDTGVLVSFCLAQGLVGEHRALSWAAVQPGKGCLRETRLRTDADAGSWVDQGSSAWLVEKKIDIIVASKGLERGGCVALLQPITKPLGHSKQAQSGSEILGTELKLCNKLCLRVQCSFVGMGLAGIPSCSVLDGHPHTNGGFTLPGFCS